MPLNNQSFYFHKLFAKSIPLVPVVSNRIKGGSGFDIIGKTIGDEAGHNCLSLDLNAVVVAPDGKTPDLVSLSHKHVFIMVIYSEMMIQHLRAVHLAGTGEMLGPLICGCRTKLGIMAEAIRRRYFCLRPLLLTLKIQLNAEYPE